MSVVTDLRKNQGSYYYGSGIRVLDFALANYTRACELFEDVIM